MLRKVVSFLPSGYPIIVECATPVCPPSSVSLLGKNSPFPRVFPIGYPMLSIKLIMLRRVQNRACSWDENNPASGPGKDTGGERCLNPRPARTWVLSKEGEVYSRVSAPFSPLFSPFYTSRTFPLPPDLRRVWAETWQKGENGAHRW